MSKELVKSDIKVTIGMLVSNHIQYIRKTMESLQPLLKAVPSELIVVDTKGAETDGSIAVVREYTDKIYPFTWCDDFAAARNVCMEHARGEWFLYLDDDEWFEDVTEFIEFFQSEECDNYNFGFYYTHDYDADGTYSASIAGRMIRRRVNTRFEGRVHESFNEIYSPGKQFSCFTNHYGYAFQNAEEAKKHQERNVSILKKELVANGATPRLCAQMVQELMHLEETAPAGFNFAMDALRRLKNALQDNCTQWIMVATVRCFARNKNLEGAKAQLAYLESNYELSEIAQLALAGTIANIASASWACEDMLKYAGRYVELWDWKQEHEQETMLQTQLDLPKFYEDKYYYQMLHVGAAAANRLERYNAAEAFWNRMPWEQDGFDGTKYKEERDKTKEGLKKLGIDGIDKVIGNAQLIQNPVKIDKNAGKAPRLIKSNVKLTIGMLVSNHIQYIRNCMEALKPLLEAVPSELIVVDTMGEQSDGSIEIVKEYTDKIYPFTWCNDFSAARNVCIEHAKGEWFLYVDDDEWFDDVQEFIDFFNSKECENYYSGYYYTRDYLPDDSYSVGIAGRIIRRTDQTCFEGRIHEHFNVVYSPNKQFSCFTHHYGYKYENEEARARKQKRNVDILREEIRDKGLNSQRAAQMVQELLSRRDTSDEGYRLSLEYIAELEKMGKLEESCSQWVLVAGVRHFADNDRYEQMMQQAETIQRKYPLTEVTKLVLAASVIMSVALRNECELILRYADLYLENYDWRLAHPEEALLQTQLDFPKFFTDDYYHYVAHVAAVTCNYQKNYTKANHYLRRLPWGTEGFNDSVYQEALNTTIRGLQEITDTKYKEKMKALTPLMDVLEEAGMQLKQLYQTGNRAIAKEYLSAMQNAAIALGKGLDDLIGQGSTTVALLEQYCELLYNCHKSQNLEEELALADIIGEATLLVKETFAKDTRKKKTILLCPSKAADWPLFEPYWQEAKQNGDKVVVIPVPHYEKRYDGKLLEEIYEGDAFPEDIPVTRYDAYKYSGKLADVIVVKEDYNNRQTFTSVHPFYYIDNLKKYAKEVEVIPEWDGGIRELESRIEALRKLIEE